MDTSTSTVVPAAATTASPAVPFFSQETMPPLHLLPGILKLCCGRCTNFRDFDAAIAMAVSCVLPAYLHRDVKFQFPGSMSPERPVLMGFTLCSFSGGKSYGLTVANEVLSEVRQEDERERDREDKFKESREKALAAKKEGGKIPTRKPFKIRIISLNATPASFQLRQLDLKKHGAIGVTLLPEIDGYLNFGSGKRGVSDTLRRGYESGELSSERVSEKAVSGSCDIAWSSYAAGTHLQLLNFLGNQVENGLQSRFLFSEIEEQQLGVEVPKFPPFDRAFHEELHTYTSRLKKMKPGTYTVPELEKWVARERKRMTEYAVSTGDSAMLKLSRRALLSAARVGFFLYICNDCVWAKNIDNYLTVLYCKSLDLAGRMFGDALDKILAVSRSYSERKSKTKPCLLEKLPAHFTLEDVLAAREAAGFLDARNIPQAKEMVKNWVRKKMVTRVAKLTWEKTATP